MPEFSDPRLTLSIHRDCGPWRRRHLNPVLQALKRVSDIPVLGLCQAGLARLNLASLHSRRLAGIVAGHVAPRHSACNRTTRSGYILAGSATHLMPQNATNHCPHNCTADVGIGGNRRALNPASLFRWPNHCVH